MKKKPVVKTPILKVTGKSTQDKIDYVAKLWGNTGYATLFVNDCKKTDYANECVQRGSSIALHESNAGRAGNAFFGVLVDRHHSYDWQIRRRVQRFVKNRWYERKTVSDWNRGGYCQSEDGKKGCPNRLINVDAMANTYDELF